MMKKTIMHAAAIALLVGFVVLALGSAGSTPSSTSSSTNRNAASAQKRGMSYMEQENWDAAIQEFTNAIQIDPNDPFTYFFRGTSYSRKAEELGSIEGINQAFDLAIADFDKAIQLKPMTTMYQNRGYAYMIKGNFTRAIADFDEAIKLDPNNVNARDLRDMALERVR